MAEPLQEMISSSDPSLELMIGIGEAAQGIDGLRKSFKQAVSAMIVMRSRSGKNGNISHYRDLGILQLLAQEGENENFQDFVKATIGKIIDYDREKGTGYLLTLEVILKSDSLKDAAQILFLHPNTVLFRRKRIEKLLCVSFDDFETRLALIAAVKLHKLSK